MSTWIWWVVGALVLMLTIAGIVLKFQRDNIARLNTEVGALHEALSSCQRVNDINTAENKKIADAIVAAKGEADAANEKVKTVTAKLNRRILEISNAKDNGPVPAVLQRTIDSVRERAETNNPD